MSELLRAGAGAEALLWGEGGRSTHRADAWPSIPPARFGKDNVEEEDDFDDEDEDEDDFEDDEFEDDDFDDEDFEDDEFEDDEAEGDDDL